MSKNKNENKRVIQDNENINNAWDRKRVGVFSIRIFQEHLHSL